MSYKRKISFLLLAYAFQSVLSNENNFTFDEQSTLIINQEDILMVSSEQDYELITVEEGVAPQQKSAFLREKDSKKTDDDQQEKYEFASGKKEGRRFLQNTPFIDTKCPQSEPYVAYANIYQQGATFQINDIKLRKTDRMQYVTGYFREAWQRYNKCFIAKITSRGDFEATKALIEYSGRSSECQAIAIVPYVHNILAVGFKQESSSGSSAKQAILVYTDSSLQLIGVKEFHNEGTVYSTSNYDIVAYDVAIAEGDGSIYITGTLASGHTRSTGIDCFVIKLDSSLNRIYAKSFGSNKNSAGSSLSCKSIQVTRNSDYIYVGGENDKGLFFSKMSSNLNKVFTTTLTSNIITDTLTMRRLLLEQDVVLDNNQKLYFCGFTSSNSGDMLFGAISSNDVHSATTPHITIDQVFQYGSTGTESIGLGDCKLTEDNKYFVGLLTTNHNKALTFNRINGGVDPNMYSYGYKFSTASYFAPYPYLGACNAVGFASMLDNTNKANIRDSCETQMKNEIQDYSKNYNKFMYSWRVCSQSFNYQMQKASCSIFDFRYTNCGVTGFCGNAQCDEFLSLINSKKDWYSRSNNPYCSDKEFISNTWERMFLNNRDTNGLGFLDTGIYTINSIKQYMFCMQQPPQACGAPSINVDDVDFIFDQDCTDTNNYPSHFIFKFQTSKFTSANVDSIPELAANFGDGKGSFYGHALAVDQFGYIYVHGNTDSYIFKGYISTPSCFSWIHTKTHWEMSYEVNCLSDGTLANNCTDWWYMGIRFKIPNQYRNNQGSETFMQNFYTPGLTSSLATVTSSITLDNAQDFNREMAVSGNWQNFYADMSFSYIYRWGESYVRMNHLSDIYVYKPKLSSGTNKFTYSFSLHDACIMRDQAKVTNEEKYREQYLYKEAFMEETLTAAGFTVNTVAPGSTDSFTLSWNVDLITTEKIHYLSLRVTTQSFDIQYTSQFKCEQHKYGYFWNDKDFTQLRRFETSQRVKIVVDLESVKFPSVDKSLLNHEPTVRQLYQIDKVDTYFRDCTLFSARHTSQNLTSWYNSAVKYNSYQLPYWIQFHEANKSFTMFPPDTKNKINIEVKCCNTIEQCVVSTFYINPKDTAPSNDLNGRFSNYVLRYDSDPLSSVGEGFQWGMRNSYFYDKDLSSDVNDILYRKTDHQIDMDFIGSGVSFTGTNKFRYLLDVGIAFWQGYSSFGGPNIMQYRYTDSDSSTTTSPSLGQISVYVNKIPHRTSSGRAATLSFMDPCKISRETNYFDKFFPFKANDDIKQELKVSLSTWFSQGDADTITYQLSYSDLTPAPSWILFDPILGQTSGYPLRQDSSELINLRFGATDSFGGESYLLKQFLVNCVPEPLVTRKSIVFGLNRNVKFDLRELAIDLDGDLLTFSLTSNTDEEWLNMHGLVFQDTTKTIVGRTTREGYNGNIQIKATDVHGNYVNTYISIKIDNFKPQRRISDSKEIYADRVDVVQGQQFSFQIPDNLYYDINQDTPLVFFAANNVDLPPPSWIQYYPQTRVFYGLAPMQLQYQQIRVYAMHPFTHDSISFQFTINVIRNSQPKLQMKYMGPDLVAKAGSWWEYTAHIAMFKDKEWKTGFYSLAAYGEKRTPLPSWVTFNSVNRTLMGWIDKNKAAGQIFHFELVYTDFQGKQAQGNFKLTIQPPSQQKLYLVFLLVFLTCSSFVVLLVFVLFLFSYHSDLKLLFNPSQKDLYAKTARKRFLGYLDVNIRLQQKQSDSDDSVQNKYKYQLSQIGRRVLGKAGGIKFVEPATQKKTQQHYNVMAYEPEITGFGGEQKERRKGKEEEDGDTVHDFQVETEQSLMMNSSSSGKFMITNSEKELRIKGEQELEKADTTQQNKKILADDEEEFPTVKISEEESRLSQFIKKHLKKTVATKPQV